MAEGQGFEPWEPLDSPVFKTGAFDHSATPPKDGAYFIDLRKSVNTRIRKKRKKVKKSDIFSISVQKTVTY
jgi:hypothetical protein